MEGFDIPCSKCIKSTDKAILVFSEEDPIAGQVWIPQSQIHDDSEVYENGDEGTLVVNMWWAEKQGWI